MSEESDLFAPSRMQMFREFNRVLSESKDLEEAKTKFRALIVSLILNED